MKSKGFALTQLLLILVLVLAVGGVGWYVFQNQNKSDPKQTKNVQDKEHTDSAQIFAFAYPGEWSVRPFVWEPCCGDLNAPENIEPDWNVVSQPITLLLANGEEAPVSIKYWNQSEFVREGQPKNFDELKAVVADQYNTFETVEINGRQALYNRTDYLGPPDAKVESFLDHRYYFFNGSYILEVYFRERYHHDWFPENDLDDSRYKADFEKIVRSVRFL